MRHRRKDWVHDEDDGHSHKVARQLERVFAASSEQKNL